MTATATVGDKNGQQTALPEVADPLPKIQSSKWIICDKLGWPVERIRGKWLVNFLRVVIHGRRLRRWTGVGKFDCLSGVGR